MPYINYKEKSSIGGDLGGALYPTNIDTAGGLQYAIAQLINEYFRQKPNNYQTRNDVMGALAGAQMEFYRRVVVPYEDKKINENGDVYDIS